MRATNSTTSLSSNALPSDSIGTACLILRNFGDGAAPTLLRQRLRRREFGVRGLQRLVAAAQRIIFSVRNGRRIFLVIAAVMRGDFLAKPRMFRTGVFGATFLSCEPCPIMPRDRLNLHLALALASQ